MPSQFRIPKARLDGVYGAIMTRVAKRMWGEVPDNAYVLWHSLPVARAVFGFEQKVAKWTALLASQGYSDVCELPLARAGTISG